MPEFLSMEESIQPAGSTLEPEVQRALLDPTAWRHALEKYALAVNVAVALVDTNGNLLGECINVRPVWKLLNDHKPPGTYGCPFSLEPLPPCRCIRDAFAKDKPVITRDRTGQVHFTVPLALGGYKLGVLIAGQAFDQYPEQLPLEQVAKRFHLPPQIVWLMARDDYPIRKATLQVYAELLFTLGNSFVQTRYSSIREGKRLDEMTQLRDLLVLRTQELTAMDQAKDKFLAMLGHELRNPLGAISNAIYVLDAVGSLDDRVARSYAVIKRQVRNLSRMMDELLDISRINSGKIVLNLETLDLKEIVMRSIGSIHAAIQAKGHEISTTMEEAQLTINGDPERLDQVICNLLSNSLKYTPPGGRICVSVQREGEEAILKIRDSGVGIEPAMLSHIFDLFTQLKSSLPRAEGGLGIGLSLVRTLVKMHGGSVVAFSAGPGQGSEFTVRLPLVIAPLGESPPKPEETREPMTSAVSRRIMIIEDDADNRDMLQVLLESLGHQVVTARTGVEGLKMIKSNPPQVALIDIGLPDLSGYRVAEEIRTSPGGGEIFLIACTGYGRSDDRRRALDAGFDAHLVKPASPDQILSLLAAPRPGRPA